MNKSLSGNWRVTADGASVQAETRLNHADFVAQYQEMLTQWKTLRHPARLPLDAFNARQKSETLVATLSNTDLPDYRLAAECLHALPVLEKLCIVQQAIDLQAETERRQLPFFTDISHVCIHRAGMCAWLPPAPAFFARDETNDGKHALVHLLLQVLGYNEAEPEKWQGLEKNAEMPWAWGSFIEDYLNQDINRFPDKQDNFRFLFYQAWLYLAANRLAFKDKILTDADYAILQGLGKQLGLSVQQIQRLDVLAQQQHPVREELMMVAVQ
ncbi:MAG: hypothetical protein GY862_32890 [Gammaproteobacteria bacterium]|nr:hypothetical protein [Gammaproteobacteria bacterium]